MSKKKGGAAKKGKGKETEDDDWDLILNAELASKQALLVSQNEVANNEAAIEAQKPKTEVESFQLFFPEYN